MGELADRPSTVPFRDIISLWANADLVVGNLECPLLSEELGQKVEGKCTLRGHPGWADVLKKCGFGVVSLANNHMMDYGVEGLFSTMEALDRAGIYYAGAGEDIETANSPLIINLQGKKIAFLARTVVEVSSPSYAEFNKPGVAYFREDEIIPRVLECSKTCDIVILSLHWGIEHYSYPSPQQRVLAKKLVSAGVDIVLGHHPHVLQGEEKLDSAIVSYSSGNFLFDDVPWSYFGEDGQKRTAKLLLTEENRKGMILEIYISKNKEIKSKRKFCSIKEKNRIVHDSSYSREMSYLDLSKRLGYPNYKFFWKIYSFKREWDLRIKTIIDFKNFHLKLKKLRFHHVRHLLYKIKKSIEVAMGKTTNPYE